MKKTYLFSLAAAALTSVGIVAATQNTHWSRLGASAESAEDVEAPRQKASSAQDEDYMVMYGHLQQNSAWDAQTGQRYGVYQFDNTADPSFTPVGPLGQYESTGGGFYLDGYYYFLQTRTSNTETKVNNNFVKMNVDTWKVVDSTNHSTPTKSTSVAMAYDYTTSTAYAICNQANSPNPVWLRTVDLDNGEMTDVAPIAHPITALAIDGDGQLWGISKENTGWPRPAFLYKINKTNGECTKVGELGYNQHSANSAAVFDLRNNKLYWTALHSEVINEYQEQESNAYMFEVDTKTGKATIVKPWTYWQVFTNMFMIDCAPKGPEAASDVKFNYDEDNLSGTVSCTLPTRSYNRSTLTGNLKVEVLLDGKVVQTATAKPGDKFVSDNVSFKKNAHLMKVICYAATGEKGLHANLNIWGGVDLPAKVTNIQAVANKRGDTVEVTWDPVTTGKGNGAIDTSTLTYKVIRRPDQKVVADNLTECKFTDNITDRNMLLSQYEVHAVTPNGESEAAYSSTLLAGAAYQIPYLETFDTRTAFNSFTVIDQSGNGNANGDTWLYWPDYQCAVYWVDQGYWGHQANAWLITPTLDLDPEKCYRIAFYVSGSYTIFNPSTDYPARYTIALGDEATVESLDREVYHIDYLSGYGVERYITSTFVPEDDECRIGIHLWNNGWDSPKLDNLRVMEYGSAYIPAAPEIVSAVNEDGVIKYSFKVPTTSAKGKAMNSVSSVTVTRNNKKIEELTDVTPGQVISLEDDSPAYSDNDYVIYATNEEGRGLEGAFTISARPDAPKSVENVTVATLNDGRNALISWNYPEDMLGANGLKLKEDHLSYNIYRVINTAEKVLVAEGVKGNSYEVVDVMSAFPEKRQSSITYAVEAVTDGGKANIVSNKNIFGRAYELPVSYGFGNSEIAPWETINVTTYGAFGVGSGWEPRVEAETDGVVLSYYTSLSGTSAGYYKSPRFNLTSMKNPKFTFAIWHSTYTGYDRSQVRIGIASEKNGIEQSIELLPEIFNLTEGEGWIEHEVDLSKYADCTRASLLIYCEIPDRTNKLHIDRIGLTGEKPEYDARLTSITGPSAAVMGRENRYIVTVLNYGTKDLDKVNVTLKKGEELIGTKDLVLNEGESLDVPFDYAPGLDATEHSDVLTATVTAANDENRLNDTETMRISVVAPNLPYVTEFDGTVVDGEYIRLFWDDATIYPGAAPEVDDFESYKDFDIEGAGEWKFYDADGNNTLPGISDGYNAYTWENIGKPQSFIVFNPAKVGITSLTTARSGARCLACFTAEGSGNEDWLISPALYGQAQTVSFYAKALMVQSIEDAEVYDVMVSYSGTEIEDFVPLASDVHLSSMTWQKYSYNLPAGVRHFAIVCKSKQQWALLIDDVEYIRAQPSVELTGYNVYRDGVKLATVGENEYEDHDVNPATDYRYNVTAEYAEGESIFSKDKVIGVLGLNSVAADSAIRIYSTAGRINVAGAAGQYVAVYTTDGRCVYNFKATANTESMTMAPGLYVVRAGNTSAKVLVK